MGIIFNRGSADDVDMCGSKDPFTRGEPLCEVARTVYNWMRGHGNSSASMIEIKEIIGERKLLDLAKKYRW